MDQAALIPLDTIRTTGEIDTAVIRNPIRLQGAKILSQVGEIAHLEMNQVY